MGRTHLANPAAAPPAIVRVAGLPLDVVERFSSGLCDFLAPRAALQTATAEARAELADRLYEAVPRAEPRLRRFLLAVRRDCHNGRPVHPHTRDPRWSALRDAAGPPADRVAALEREAEAHDAAFEAAFTAELERQRASLLEPLRDPEFLRGLSLASPDLVEAIRALDGEAPGAGGRKERKIEASLLRYVCRAATKVSPFSTLATVGIGGISDASAELAFAGRPWERGSLVRIKRYLLHRVTHLLCTHAPFRDPLGIRWNDSLVEVSPERFLYLRSHHWALDPETGILTYRQDALAAANLRGPLIAATSRVLTDHPRCTYQALAAALAEETDSGGEDAVRRKLDRMLDLGVLQFRLPWPIHTPHLEKRMLEHLRTLPRSPRLDALTARLADLVRQEDGFATSADPPAAVRALRRAVDDVGHAAAELAGIPPEALEPDRPQIFEDVIASPARGSGRAPRAGIADVPRAAMEEALENAGLLVRLSVLLDHRQDFRHTLAALAPELWPGRRTVPLLEVIREVQPLWHTFMEVHVSRWRDPGRAIQTWNPRGLPALASLNEWRLRVWKEVGACMPEAPGPRHMDPDALRAALDQAPAGFTSAAGWGAMMMLQPASPDGSLWMLNKLKEGTGRYASRYTPAMEPETRAWYADHLAARGVMQVDGEPAELLDVHCVQGDTLNVHAPQTPRVLVMPDDETDLPPQRRVALSDLRVAFDGADGLPAIRHRDGCRFLPVNLGLAFEAYLPSILKFLCLFGPSELGTVLPPFPQRTRGPVSISDRTVLGNLVLRRGSWRVPAEILAGALEGCTTDAEFFVAANRCRLEWGIPERVFVWEPLPHDFFKKAYKPQYLDFTSPFSVPLLRSLVVSGEPLSAVEVLPTPEMCPRDDQGRRWATELIVDSLALRPIRARTDVAAGRARRTSGRLAPAGA